MSNPLVYLAGPITGLSYGGAVDWRRVAAERLRSRGITALSPMRHKDYLAGEQVIGDSYEDSLLSCARGITTRDRFDTLRCDLVLMNLLGATRVSIGSMIEMGWANGKGTPVVIVMEQDNPHQHAMVNEIAGFPCIDNLDAALTLVERVLVP